MNQPVGETLSPPLRETPLQSRHAALGASFTDFGGWSMPVRYSSELAEHRAVREAAGLFDISHMAEFVIDGADSPALLDHALAGRLSTLSPGRAKYSLLLAADGGIIDDVIVYRLAGHRFLVIANAGNHEPVADALRSRRTGFDATVADISEEHALLAVQGPQARRVLESTAGIGAFEQPLDELRYYSSTSADFDDAPVLIARTGYTGEDGFELLVPNAAAAALWDALLAAGSPLGLVPAGLAARDTLRLEAGMPLYGHELSRDVRPAQAGLGRVVALDKDFVGHGGVHPAGDAPVLVGLTSEGRRAGRAGYPVLDSVGSRVGEITSGALSPTLGRPIAMAFVSPSVAEPGTVLAIDVRGTPIPATVTTLPFYRRNP